MTIHLTMAQTPTTKPEPLRIHLMVNIPMAMMMMTATTTAIDEVVDVNILKDITATIVDGFGAWSVSSCFSSF